MNIATLIDGVVVNVYIYDSLEEAETLMSLGAFGDINELIKLPDGFWIGDRYTDGQWKKVLPTSF